MVDGMLQNLHTKANESAALWSQNPAGRTIVEVVVLHVQ